VHGETVASMVERRRARSRKASSGAGTGYTVATITLWGNVVGAVAEDSQGQITFEYDETFRAGRLNISPIHLPLSRRGPIVFPELQRLDAFAGLPGLLADSLPDAFGNAVVRRYFEQRGMPDAALSPVQRLLYIGARAMGALEFRPAMRGGRTAAADTALEVAQLVEEARRVIEGDPHAAVPEIMMQVGASAGGARAKALILWNRNDNRVKSAFARRDHDDEHWLIKFDGVTPGIGGHAITKDFAPGPYGRTEYVYSKMARAAGIEMVDTHLMHERDFAHFMTKRFDRHGDAKLHMHSLGGLQHVDYNVPRAFSYEAYFRTIRQLGLNQGTIEQAFRRMVFNIIARNQDDHVKNFAFLMSPDGKWQLSPAFDVTWAYGGRWTSAHQMTVNGKGDDFARDDITHVGRLFDLPKGGDDIIAETEAAVQLWEDAAQEVGLEADWIKNVSAGFRRLV